MKKGFILHQFNLRECYALFMRSLGREASGFKDKADNFESPLGDNLEESLMSEKSIGNYQSYNYKPSQKLPKYLVSQASNTKREDDSR